MGAAAEGRARAAERAGRPLLFPQPLLPRAQRDPVRAGDRRAGIRVRRADGNHGRALVAPAVPRTAAGRDRGGTKTDLKPQMNADERRYDASSTGGTPVLRLRCK